MTVEEHEIIKRCTIKIEHTRNENYKNESFKIAFKNVYIFSLS